VTFDAVLAQVDDTLGSNRTTIGAVPHGCPAMSDLAPLKTAPWRFENRWIIIGVNQGTRRRSASQQSSNTATDQPNNRESSGT